jgi:hypothetical protein
MAELGNNIVNKILEGGQTLGRKKPGPEATRAEREAWIFAKYREKLFVDRDIFQADELKDNRAWTVKRLRRRARSHQLQKRRADEKEAAGGSLAKEEKRQVEEEEEKDLDTSEEPSLLESVLRASTLASATRPPGTGHRDCKGGNSTEIKESTLLP